MNVFSTTVQTLAWRSIAGDKYDFFASCTIAEAVFLVFHSHVIDVRGHITSSPGLKMVQKDSTEEEEEETEYLQAIKKHQTTFLDGQQT